MKFYQSILSLFYPSVCVACSNHINENEKILCTTCRHDLPETHFINSPNNIVEKTFEGRVPIEAGTALLYYGKTGVSRELIHHLKYKNREDIGAFFGEWMGDEIHNSPRFKNLDGIIKVPLHPKKERLRGYNQLTVFCTSLANRLNISVYDDVLLKIKESSSQTKKGRMSRFEKINENFKMTNTEKLKGKHILLVDDVITTGATLEACAIEILKIENVKLSIATMVVPNHF